MGRSAQVSIDRLPPNRRADPRRGRLASAAPVQRQDEPPLAARQAAGWQRHVAPRASAVQVGFVPRPASENMMDDAGTGALRDRQELTALVGRESASRRLDQTAGPDSVISVRALSSIGYGTPRDRPRRHSRTPCRVNQTDHCTASAASPGVMRPARSSERPTYSTRLAVARNAAATNRCHSSGKRSELGGDAAGTTPKGATSKLSRARSNSIVEGRVQISTGVVRAHRAERDSAASRIRSGNVGQVDSLRNAIIAHSTRYSPSETCSPIASWITLKAIRATAAIRYARSTIIQIRFARLRLGAVSSDNGGMRQVARTARR
jgi:hypothetical protein